MTALMKNCVTRVATFTGVNLASATKQGNWTVPPTVNSFTPMFLIIRNSSGNASAGTISAGGNANADDFLALIGLTNLNAAGAAVQAHPLGVKTGAMVASPSKDYAAGAIFGVKPGTTVAFTCDIDVFGIVR